MVILSQAYLDWERQTQAQGMEQGLQQGAEREAKTFVLRLLTRRVGEVSAERRAQINALPLHQLEGLGEALLEFRTIADLDNWFQENQ